MKPRRALTPDPSGGFVLALVRPLAPLWKGLGANPADLLLLLRLRFVMSARRQLGPAQNIKGIGVHVALTFVLGFLFLPLLLMEKEEPGRAIAFGQGLVLFFMAFNMIFVLNEFLFDEAEGVVIRPCPVDDRTVVLARSIHAGGYLGLIALALTVSHVLIGAIALGPAFGAAYAVATASMTLLAAALFLLACGVVLRFVGVARFKSAVGWGQLLMLIALYSLQFNVALLLETFEDHGLFQERGLWCLAFPPLWGTALFERLSGQPGEWSGVLSLALLLVPVLVLAVALRSVRSGFLAAVSHRGGGGAPRARRVSLFDRIARASCRSGAERAGWHMLAKAGPRDARFRLRVVPMMALPMLAVGGLFFQDPDMVTPRHLALGFLYLPIVGLGTLEGAADSERYRAAWVFRANPLEGPAAVWAGVVRLACVATVALPASLLAIALVVAFGLDGLIASATGLPVALAGAVFFLPRIPGRLPFSRKPRQTGGMESVGTVMFAFLILGLAAPVVFFASAEAWTGLALGGASLAVALSRWRSADWPVPTRKPRRAIGSGSAARRRDHG